MTEIHFIIFPKLVATISDAQNSHSIAFITTSDQYATVVFLW